MLGLADGRQREIVSGERAYELARPILIAAGRTDLVSRLVQHYTHDGKPYAVANDCAHCGELQGNFYLEEYAGELLEDGDGLEVLEILAEGSCAADDLDGIEEYPASWTYFSY